jgi:glycosyl transferase family 87
MTAVWVIGLCLVFAWMALRLTEQYRGILKMPFLDHLGDFGGSDFPAFYAGAKLFLVDPGRAYDPDAQGQAVLEAKRKRPEEASNWDRYYNPPIYSLILAPLTAFEMKTAFGLALIANVVGLIFLLAVVRRLLGNRNLAFALFAIGILTSQSLMYAFWHGQPTVFLAALLGVVYLDAGSHPRRAGIASALLFVKLHWIALPALTLPRLGRRLLLTFGITLCLMLAPFLLLGPHGIHDYLALVLGRGRGDLMDESFAEAVLSWSGFFRGLAGEPRPLPAFTMCGLTLALFAVIRWKDRGGSLPLAGGLTLLLLGPHSHPQDWIMLVPAAAVLVREQRSATDIAVTALLLIAINLGLDNWSHLRDRRDVVYWPTVFGFALLVWLACRAMLLRYGAGLTPRLRFMLPRLAGLSQTLPAASPASSRQPAGNLLGQPETLDIRSP